MSLLVLGLSGVGKSTVCARLSNKLNVASVNLGRLILSRAVDDPDFRNLAVQSQRKIIEQGLVAEYDPRELIVDAHAVFISDNETVVYGFDADDFKILSVQAILLIEASPAIIIHRRTFEQSNRPDRRLDSEKYVKDLQTTQREYVRSMCIDCSILLYIFENNSTVDLDRIIYELRRFD